MAPSPSLLFLRGHVLCNATLICIHMRSLLIDSSRHLLTRRRTFLRVDNPNPMCRIACQPSKMWKMHAFPASQVCADCSSTTRCFRFICRDLNTAAFRDVIEAISVSGGEPVTVCCHAEHVSSLDRHTARLTNQPTVQVMKHEDAWLRDCGE